MRKNPALRGRARGLPVAGGQPRYGRAPPECETETCKRCREVQDLFLRLALAPSVQEFVASRTALSEMGTSRHLSQPQGNPHEWRSRGFLVIARGAATNKSPSQRTTGWKLLRFA